MCLANKKGPEVLTSSEPRLSFMRLMQTPTKERLGSRYKFKAAIVYPTVQSRSSILTTYFNFSEFPDIVAHISSQLSWHP